ncbi:MAG: hypothetical protein ACTSVE_04830 [Candidatus Helarchaeota archaeon]
MVLDVYELISIICSIIGILIFIYGEYLVIKILELFPKAKMRRDWKIIFILIVFFIGGYVVNIISLLCEITLIITFMQAFVYIFGAIFVFIVIRLSYKTYKILIETAQSE